MPLYDQSPSESDAALSEMRVPIAELTRALAEIEAHKARQAFEQAGTLTLAEALEESNIEATPEEVAEEVRKLHQADALAAKKQKHRRRLHLTLRAELISALLCGLTLLSLSRTVYNPQWQALRQRGEVRNILQLTQGPNPQYQIFVVPETFRQAMASGSADMNRGIWANSPAYPLSFLPDGFNIHHYDGLNDDGNISPTDAAFMPTFPAYFEFRPVVPRSIHEMVSVFYNGQGYRRGWIRKSDIPNLLHGRPFLYYPEPVDDPQDHHAGLAPLTLSNQSIAEAKFELRFAGDTGYESFAFNGGAPVQLDAHAWEAY